MRRWLRPPLLFLTLAAGTLGVWRSVAWVAAPAVKVDYCYIDKSWYGYLALRGHRPWALDRGYGQYDSAKGAVETAQYLGCRLELR